MILKKIKFFLIILLLFINNLLYSTSLDMEYKYNTADGMDIRLNKEKINYDMPNESGSVVNLPWRNDEIFFTTKEKYETPILMAAYCTVLIDPLPGESYNVDLAAKKIKGLVIEPDTIFSQNNILGPYTKEKGYQEGASYSQGRILMTTGGGVCKIATTLYNLASLSNLEIIERHNHSMPINYVPYGQDATVSFNSKDFKFKNTTNSNILIWAQLIDNKLYIAFYGKEKPPEITWIHEKKNIIRPPERYIKNENLKQGEEKLIIKGLEGAQVKSTLRIKYPNGLIKYKDMGVSHYQPLPYLFEIN